MKTTGFVLLLLSAACAGQRYAVRTPPVPPAPPARVHSAPQLIAPANEEATRAWLEREIELAPRVEPPTPIVQVVEQRVYVNAYDQYDNYGYRHDDYYDPYYRYPHRSYRSNFPVNTAVGAGIGAIIGHQSGHRNHGSWIGGSIGYLFDVTRW